MLKKNVKKMICEFAKKVSYETVGRSMPVVVHEPKVPEVLKKACEEKK